MTDDEITTSITDRFSLGGWLAMAAAALALGLMVQGLFPRYQLMPLDARSVVVFDSWTGAFQRATYDERGEPSASAVVRPF